MFRWLNRIANSPDRHATSAMRQFSACIDKGDAKGARAIVEHAKGQTLLDRLLLLACMHQIKNDDVPWMRRGRLGEQMAGLLLGQGANCEATVFFPRQFDNVNYRDPIIFLAAEHGDYALFRLMFEKLTNPQLRRNNGVLLLEDIFCKRDFALEDSAQAIKKLLKMGAPFQELPLHRAQHPQTLQLVLDCMRTPEPLYLLQKNEGLRHLAEQTLGAHGEHMLRKLIEAGADPHDIAEHDGIGCAYFRALQGGRRNTFLALSTMIPLQGDAPMDRQGNTLWHALARSMSYNDGYYNPWNRLDDSRQEEIEKITATLGSIDHQCPNHLGLTPQEIAYQSQIGQRQWDAIVESLAQKTRLDHSTLQAGAEAQARRL